MVDPDPLSTPIPLQIAQSPFRPISDQILIINSDNLAARKPLALGGRNNQLVHETCELGLVGVGAAAGAAFLGGALVGLDWPVQFELVGDVLQDEGLAPEVGAVLVPGVADLLRRLF